jgi:hypothetical protein
MYKVHSLLANVCIVLPYLCLFVYHAGFVQYFEISLDNVVISSDDNSSASSQHNTSSSLIATSPADVTTHNHSSTLPTTSYLLTGALLVLEACVLVVLHLYITHQRPNLFLATTSVTTTLQHSDQIVDGETMRITRPPASSAEPTNMIHNTAAMEITATETQPSAAASEELPRATIAHRHVAPSPHIDIFSSLHEDSPASSTLSAQAEHSGRYSWSSSVFSRSRSRQPVGGEDEDEDAAEPLDANEQWARDDQGRLQRKKSRVRARLDFGTDPVQSVAEE